MSTRLGSTAGTSNTRTRSPSTTGSCSTPTPRSKARTSCTELTAKQRAAKLGKRKAERQLDQFEERILRIHPAPKGNNTLKALTAHIQKAAFEKEDTGAQYEQLREDFETAEDALIGIDSKLSQVRMWLDAIDAAQEAIRTHLSWVKADAGGGRRRG
jgi:chromosome segregation ATPase